MYTHTHIYVYMDFHVYIWTSLVSNVKNSPFNAGNASLIPDWKTKILHVTFN